MSPILTAYPGLGTMPFTKLRLSDGTFVNPRTSSGLSAGMIRALAVHIGFHGLMTPLIVTVDGLIIAGQRRYRAIEFLLQWFSQQPPQPRAQADDHPRFVELFGEQGQDLSHEDISALERRATEFSVQGIPVRVIGGSGVGGLAIADNLQRESLSSFEIAQNLSHLQDQGATGADLARLIGKSKSYVSRKLAAWKGAGPELGRAWEAGELSDEAVEQLSALPHDQQAKALAGPIARGRRGAAGRPPIEMVKDVISEVERILPSRAYSHDTAHTADTYRTGVLDALRWVAGQKTSPEFAKLTEES